ncbi:MAG: T9SS sorting signal type C domain-containing protein [Flavobacterium sp.]|nr:T9SS sorting signal type C domain-containing protein [Flavobacterium sp.]
MKKYYIIITILFYSLIYSQNNWQSLMHDRNANFNEIQESFESYLKKNAYDSKIIPKGYGIKQFRRWEYYWQNRVDINGDFPKEGHVLEEILKYRKVEQNRNNRYAAGSGNWQPIGPIALPNNGTTQLNGNGRLTCITFHPTNPDIIFVGSPAGGIWKTTDGGATWSEFSIGLIRLGVSSIVINPSNPDIIYIGTGDRDSGDSPGYGVWRSTNGGLSWTQQNNGMGNRTVYEILMNPSNPNDLVASTSGSRIYKSTDGGANWTFTTTSSAMKDIAYKPGDFNTIYASGTTFDVSTNAGASFSQVTSGVPTGAQRIALAVSPDEPNWVYLLAGGGSGLIEISRSTNSGSNFSTRTTTPNILGYATNGNDTRSQAIYDLVLAADPTNANTIYAGGINIWKSTDGGATMNCASYWVGPSGLIDGVHADQHVLEFSPHNNSLYSGNDGGIYITTDNGTNWDDLSSGLAIAQLYKIGVSQTVPNLLIHGHQDNGTSVSRGSVFSTEIGGDGMECIIDPTDANYMYGALYYGDIRRSTNGGNTFSAITGSISETGAWVTPYKLDPNNSNTMFAGYDNIWRNIAVKTGTTWTQISNFGGTSNIADIAIASSNSNIMYVSRSSSTDRFYRTSNALNATPSWTDLSANLPVASTPKDIEIDPTDPTHLFIALGNDIYESTNSGNTWTNISGSLPNISLNTIVIDKDSPVNAMYVGMDVGVYYKDNNLSDWVAYSTGLAYLEITELEIYSNSADCESKLYAATYGQGTWISNLKDPGNIAPKACFKANVLNACVGTDVVFTDNSDYSPTSWSWSITPATFVYVNGTSSSSQNPVVQFTNPGSYTIALTATNANGNDIKTNPSYIDVQAGSIATAFNDNFESNTLCGTTSDCGSTMCSLGGLWTNLVNRTDDNIDWRVDEGGTPSTGTGPSVDFNPGTGSGNYLYLEASSCFNQVAILESQCIQLDKEYDFVFAYHMFGTDMGRLHIDLYTNGEWIEDITPALSGDKGNQWFVSTTSLYSYLGQTIKLRIRGITGNNFTSDIAIDDIKFTPKCSTTTTWNGSVWSNGIASATKNVIFTGNYTSSGNLDACTVEITNNAQVTFNSGDTFIVGGNINIATGSSLIIENNSALRQLNDAASNTGNIIVKRNATAMNRLDYTAWSSPVEGQQLQAFSPNTIPIRFYEYLYSGTSTPTAYQSVDATTNFEAGKGYMIRADNTYTGPTVFNGQFTGTPINGKIDQSIGLGYNLLGNPYSSPIDATTFLADNTTIETLYFWTNTTPASGGTYPQNNFAAYTAGTGGVAAFASGKIPNGIIQTGQGFYIKTDLATTATFNNLQRLNASSSTQFYRTSNSEKHRIWLNLNHESVPYNQILVGYIEGATNNADFGIDGKPLDLSKSMLYNLINDEAYVIQGRALPFNDEDNVTLGLKILEQGNYSISLETTDGLFTTQDIFIKDNLTNTIHNVKQSPYLFTSDEGVFDNRIELVYRDIALNNSIFTSESGIVVYPNDKGIQINASNEITNVTIHDLLGRKLYENKTINTKTFTIENIQAKNQVLLVKVNLENGQELTKKIIF